MPKLEHFSTGFTESRVFLGIKKKKVSTNGHRYQTDVGLKGLHGRTCALVQSEKKKKSSAEQFSSVVLLAAPFNLLYLSSSLRAMCRERRLFPTETKFLPSDPHHHHPSSLLLPFPSFCLSAVKGNKQSPNTHHSSRLAEKENKIKKKKTLI